MQKKSFSINLGLFGPVVSCTNHELFTISIHLHFNYSSSKFFIMYHHVRVEKLSELSETWYGK